MKKKELLNNIVQIANQIVYPSDLATKSYLIFYPTDGYHLSKEQYYAFMDILTKIEVLDEVINFDIEFIDNSKEIFDEDIRKFSSFDYSFYKSFPLIFENCITDSKLHWSICIYQDYWGIIYGSNELLCEIVKIYDFEKDLKQFREEIILGIDNIETRERFEKLISLSYVGTKIAGQV